jgi:hypothetical protein
MLSPFCLDLDSGHLYLCLLASGHIVPDFVHHAPVVNSYCPSFGLGLVLVVLFLWYFPSTLDSCYYWELCK